jgi:hypothetical protein
VPPIAVLRRRRFDEPRRAASSERGHDNLFEKTEFCVIDSR